MTTSLFLRSAAAAFGFGAATLAASSAHAANCSTLGFTSVVYVAGSTAAKGILAQVAAALAPGVTVIYLGNGSCGGVNAVIGAQTPITGTGTSGAAALSYWDNTGTEQHCDIPAPGVQADIGISDVFADTCVPLPNGLPSTVSDNLGPVQAMTFAVPNASTQTSISAEAAYFVFGFGNNSGVAPWVDETSMFIRNATSGTQAMIAAAIGVPAGLWKGAGQSGTAAVISSLNAAGMGTQPVAEKAIGILAAEDADGQRLTMRELAYQHTGQRCGYLPDSAANKFDKRNVRDGHYAIWGPIHLIKRKDIDLGNQTNIQKTIDYITGAQQLPGNVDLIKFEANARVIPQCAMRVTRMSEMGPLSKNQVTKPCGCYYEYVANTTSTCTPCSTLADCKAIPGASCQTWGGMGFCEPP
jgi:hypothetical protein